MEAVAERVPRYSTPSGSTNNNYAEITGGYPHPRVAQMPKAPRYDAMLAAGRTMHGRLRRQWLDRRHLDRQGLDRPGLDRPRISSIPRISQQLCVARGALGSRPPRNPLHCGYELDRPTPGHGGRLRATRETKSVDQKTFREAMSASRGGACHHHRWHSGKTGFTATAVVSVSDAPADPAGLPQPRRHQHADLARQRRVLRQHAARRR